jgi:hypothetical protein
MSSRPSAAQTQEARKEAAIAEFQEKKAQLKQYSDDNGHFSLVRCVLLSLRLAPRLHLLFHLHNSAGAEPKLASACPLRVARRRGADRQRDQLWLAMPASGLWPDAMEPEGGYPILTSPPSLSFSRSYSNFRLADLVTIMNGVCGLNSLFACARFLIDPTAANRPALWLGLALPVAGFGFDVFDGKIARWMHSSSMLGQEMDSLADLVRPLALP